MIATIFSNEMQDEKCWPSLSTAYQSSAKTLRYLLSSVLLSIFSARAEAPAPSQEFWNYFVEFGDAQGELFDPSDYAAVANLPPKGSQKINSAKQEIDSASEVKKIKQAPSEKDSGREKSQ